MYGTAVEKGVTVSSTGALGIGHDVVAIIQRLHVKDRMMRPALARADQVVQEAALFGMDVVRPATMLRSQQGVSKRTWESAVIEAFRGAR